MLLFLCHRSSWFSFAFLIVVLVFFCFFKQFEIFERVRVREREIDLFIFVRYNNFFFLNLKHPDLDPMSCDRRQCPNRLSLDVASIDDDDDGDDDSDGDCDE